MDALQAAMPAAVMLETDLPTPGPAVDGNANHLQLVTISPTEAWRVTVMRTGTTAISSDGRFTLTSVACSDESLQIRVSPYA